MFLILESIDIDLSFIDSFFSFLFLPKDSFLFLGKSVFFDFIFSFSLLISSVVSIFFSIVAFFCESDIVFYINSQYKFIALLASSFPGIGKSIPVGSEFVSTIATIGILSF